MFLICSYFPTEPCNAKKKNVRLSTIKTHYFTFFIISFFKQRTQAATGRCSTKYRFCNCAKTNQKIPAKEFNFSLNLQASSCNFTKVELLHKYFSYILNTDAAVYFVDQLFEEHIFKYFCRTSIFNGCFSISLQYY